MVFFWLFSPTPLRHRYRAPGRHALFFPLVWEYVKDTDWELGVLRCGTTARTIYARPTPKRVCVVQSYNNRNEWNDAKDNKERCLTCQRRCTAIRIKKCVENEVQQHSNEVDEGP